MLIKGDKIRLVKKIGRTSEIGDMFDVVDITENGAITLKSNYGIGVMSYDEFEKYFEKVGEDSYLSNWSSWQEIDFNNDTAHYMTNGEEIVFKYKNMKVKTSCLSTDTFDLEIGLNLCEKKMEVAIEKRKIKQAKSNYNVAKRKLNIMLKDLNAKRQLRHINRGE